MKCDWLFIAADALESFEKVSKNIFKCKICGNSLQKGANGFQSLYVHYKNQHTKQPIAVCGVCGKTAKNEDAMKKHLIYYH